MYLWRIKQTEGRVNGKLNRCLASYGNKIIPGKCFTIFYSAQRFIDSYVSIHKRFLKRKQGGLILRPFWYIVAVDKMFSWQRHYLHVPVEYSSRSSIKISFILSTWTHTKIYHWETASRQAVNEGESYVTKVFFVSYILTHGESIVHHSWGLSLLAYVVDSHKVVAFSKTKQTQWNTNQINPTSCFVIKLFNLLKKIYDQCTKKAPFVCQYVTAPFNNTETLGQVVQSLIMLARIRESFDFILYLFQLLNNLTLKSKS